MKWFVLRLCMDNASVVSSHATREEAEAACAALEAEPHHPIYLYVVAEKMEES